MVERTPLSFFLKGLAALAILFLLTLLMAPRPELRAVQGMIAFGAAVVVMKIVLRHFGIDWPRPRR